jgi:hypothetical protein
MAKELATEGPKRHISSCVCIMCERAREILEEARVGSEPPAGGKKEQPLVELTIATTQEVYRMLGRLVELGLFGQGRADVAEQLLREKLRELVTQGWDERKARR